eukprot:TRINITY_DN80581_c0_g1_i2.p2 TRINITY_DN80581_c0_g1~~TRINITY_DN80581_c0_g1_i2.p2  ORF type:complete len:124 (-),score=1.52 TRINITY_DN80581_c0_g1_i2:193-564(-)
MHALSWSSSLLWSTQSAPQGRVAAITAIARQAHGMLGLPSPVGEAMSTCQWLSDNEACISRVCAQWHLAVTCLWGSLQSRLAWLPIGATTLCCFGCSADQTGAPVLTADVRQRCICANLSRAS